MKRTLKGFTLVEVLIVIVIVGILIAALLPRLTGAQSRARDMARKGHLNQISTAVGIYLQDNLTLSTGYCASDTGLALTDYLTSVPTDPSSNTAYSTGCATAGDYAILPLTRGATTGNSFMIISQVENVGLTNWSGSIPAANTNFDTARVGLCDVGTCPTCNVGTDCYYVIIQ